jgi:hypothetical protein
MQVFRDVTPWRLAVTEEDILVGLIYPEDEGTTTLLNVGNISSLGTA